MTKPLIISLRVDHVSNYEFEGKLQTVLERVQELIKEHGPDARLDYNEHFYYDYDREPSPRYEVIIEREETEAEANARVKKEKEDKASRDARDKAEFERLSKKFGGK